MPINIDVMRVSAFRKLFIINLLQLCVFLTPTGLVGLQVAGGKCIMLPECYTESFAGRSHYLNGRGLF